MNRELLITLVITVVLIAVVVVEFHQGNEVYLDYVSCENYFDRLNEDNLHLSYKISQLEKQLAGLATDEPDLFVDN